MICDICLNKLEDLYNFKVQIILTNKAFRENTLCEKFSIKSESVDWVKLEVTFDDVDNNYEIAEDVSEIPLSDILHVDSVTVQNESSKNTRTKKKYVRKKNTTERYQVKTIICAECGKLLKRSSYSDHMLTQHNKEAQFECDICGAKIKTKRNLWHHKKDKHETREKVSCDKCGLIFSTRNTFYRHYKTVHLG